MGFGYTVFHAGSHHAVAVGDRLEDGLDGKPGPVTGKALETEDFENGVTCLPGSAVMVVFFMICFF